VKYEIEGSGSAKSTVLIDREKIVPLADGSAFLIENKIVRLQNLNSNPKKNKHRAQLGSFAQVHNAVISPVRPVAPKVTAASLGGGPLKSPMTGKVLSVLVKNGDVVEEGTLLLTIEAMKMENRICSEGAGKISGLSVLPGASVSVGETLLQLEVSLP
jgi:biotin carboxyl carrier protein